MENSRMLKLAKQNQNEADTLNPLKDVFITKRIREDYTQSDVEALIVNVIADIINALETNGTVNISTEHFQEFKAFLEYRKNAKNAVKDFVYGKED